MELKKILAFSSSRSGNSGFLEKAAPVIEEFLGNKPINIAFIPFADADKKYEEYACAVQSALKNPALHINVVLPSNAARIIENCEVIMVGGGNTFKLVHDLYELDLLDFIRAKIKGVRIILDGVPVPIFWLRQFQRPTICRSLNHDHLKRWGYFPFKLILITLIKE